MTTANITLQLDQNALQQATVQAVMGVLTPQVREKLLQEAIEKIVRPDRDIYGSREKRSIIEIAFQDAVRTVAGDAVRQYVAENAELRATVDRLARELIDKMLAKLSTDRDAFVTKMADAFVSSMRRD